MDNLFLVSFFWLHPGLKLSIENNSVCKNIMISPCFCWVTRLFSRDMDQNFKFSENNGYGDSYLEFFSRHFKVFNWTTRKTTWCCWSRRAHSSKGPGCCYITGRGPNWSSLGHVTGLLFCLYVKHSLPSFLNSVDFWSSISCIVLVTELADKNIIQKLGVFLMEKFRDSNSSSKKVQGHQASVLVYKNFRGIVWYSGRLDYSEGADVLFWAVKTDYFAKGTRNAILLAI